MIITRDMLLSLSSIQRDHLYILVDEKTEDLLALLLYDLLKDPSVEVADEIMARVYTMRV